MSWAAFTYVHVETDTPWLAPWCSWKTDVIREYEYPIPRIVPKTSGESGTFAPGDIMMITDWDVLG